MTDPNNIVNDDLLNRYLAGEASASEVEVVRAWMTARADQRVLLEELSGLGKDKVQYDRNALAARIKQSMAIPATKQRAAAPVWRYVSIAAVALIIILGVKYLPTTSAAAPKSYSTTRAQRATVNLPDGSVAILAPETHIVVDGRNVELRGEAVFTVTQHTGDPFTVKSGNTTTRVLGTTFGIRAYDGNVRIAVQDGKVAFDKNVLANGDVAFINNTQLQIQHNADIASLLSWTHGDLVFRNTPLREVAAQLTRWYDVNFVVTDSALANSPVTGVISAPSLTPSTLQTIAAILGAHIDRAGGTITVRP